METRTGGRISNEDRVAANDIFDLGFLAGVFDGHGGPQCAEFISQRLPANIHALWAHRVNKLKGGLVPLSQRNEIHLILETLQEAFEATDRDFMHIARARGLRDGSTALVTLLCHGFEAGPHSATVSGCGGGTAKLFVAWCGDSRAVLIRGRQALRLSEDHKPERRDETKRIRKAGGSVVRDAAGTYRVGHTPRPGRQPGCYLSTSRAFGDVELKEPEPLVIVKPEMKIQTLTPEDWAVVLCSDGVFDVMSDQDVADASWDAMIRRPGGPVEAAKSIADRAQAAGSTDNVTVLVMRLGWADPRAQIGAWPRF